jgi:hypothetical protein
MDADAEFMSSYVGSMTMPAVCVWAENSNPPDADMNIDKPVIPARTFPDFDSLRRVEENRFSFPARDRYAPQVAGSRPGGVA